MAVSRPSRSYPWLIRLLCSSGAVCADDLIDFPAGLSVVPSVLFADQNETAPGATLIAKVRPGSLPIIEAISVSAVAERAWCMLVHQKLTADSQRRQNFPPAPARAFDGVH
jgi:hypothetical protein